MKWSIGELRRYKDEPLTFSETLDVEAALKQRDSEILAVTPVQVEGLLTVDGMEYLLHYRLKTTVTVPSSRSLEPVDLPLDIAVDEVFMTREQWASLEESEEEIIVLENELIDLANSVEDNILLAIPLQVLTEAERNATELPKGHDWEVITEDDFIQQQSESKPAIDPRLAKLSALLDESKTDD